MLLATTYFEEKKNSYRRKGADKWRILFTWDEENIY